jgi:glycosyltransferase involved in cell wall biosynthesis
VARRRNIIIMLNTHTEKMKNPDISIIVTNFNYGNYVQRCLRSVINQKNVNHEVIVVDDCSTDNSLEMIRVFESDIRLFITPINSGVAAAANIGIKNAKGQFVIRVDADDYVSSDMSYFMKTYLESNHDAFCVSCDYSLVDNHENIIERKYAEDSPVSCGIMYRKDLFLQLGGYNDNMRHREEEELRKRLGDYYKIHHMRIPFYRYRMHSHNKTKSREYEETKV